MSVPTEPFQLEEDRAVSLVDAVEPSKLIVPTNKGISDKDHNSSDQRSVEETKGFVRSKFNSSPMKRATDASKPNRKPPLTTTTRTGKTFPSVKFARANRRDRPQQPGAFTSGRAASTFQLSVDMENPTGGITSPPLLEAVLVTAEAGDSEHQRGIQEMSAGARMKYALWISCCLLLVMAAGMIAITFVFVIDKDSSSVPTSVLVIMNSTVAPDTITPEESDIIPISSTLTPTTIRNATQNSSTPSVTNNDNVIFQRPNNTSITPNGETNVDFSYLVEELQNAYAEGDQNPEEVEEVEEVEEEEEEEEEEYKKEYEKGEDEDEEEEYEEVGKKYGKGEDEDEEYEEVVVVVEEEEEGELADGSPLLDILPAFTLEALLNDSSPQSRAFDWLINHPTLDAMPNVRKQQLFALATFSYSFDGLNATWPSYDIHECSWPQDLSQNISRPCESGEYRLLMFNGLWSNKFGLPPELSLLSFLVAIAISESRLQVELSELLPTQLGNLNNLHLLYLHSNAIFGTIPTTISSLSYLMDLSLLDNIISGTIPTEIGGMSNLQTLEFGYNNLEGTIPTQLGHLTKLEYLDLAFNWGLSGTIPTEIGLMTSLKTIYVYGTNVSGLVPAEVCSLPNLEEVLIDYYNRNNVHCNFLCAPCYYVQY